MILRESDDRKNITDGISFFTEGDLFKKKENRFLLQVFGLSILLFVIVSRLLPSDSDISYFLSLIYSVLIINGYNKAKKEDR